MINKKQIITWMCKHWNSQDILDESVQRFGKNVETITFCEKIALKIEKILANLPGYLEGEIGGYNE